MSVEFFLVSLVLAIVPGTGVVFTLACAMSQGMRGAIWGAVAGAVGVIPHLAAAGLGLSALLIAYPMIYDGLRILGGIYLLWLAVQAWRHRHDALEVGRVSATGLQIVTQGALINLLNPKLTLFFVSFLPQFVPPTDPAPLVTMGLMGLVLVAQTFFVFLAYGAVAAQAGELLRRRPQIMTVFQTGIAVLFVGLGLRVIFGNR
jgi:threonine/homoserine/homoserine lactone efflux protein